jgi:aspartate-semialdehyde dehydrogenase
VNQDSYPLVADCAGKDPVFVGRIHQDLCEPNKFLMWVVADNVRKGAALNGMQIAEHIFDIRP